MERSLIVEYWKQLRSSTSPKIFIQTISAKFGVDVREIAGIIFYYEQYLTQEDPINQLLDFEKHLCLVCATRSGKSTFLQHLISALHIHLKGECEFFVADPKNTDWLGLQDDPSRVVYLPQNNVLSLYDLLYKLQCKIQCELQSRLQCTQAEPNKDISEFNFKPWYFIIEEWFIIFSILRNAEKLNGILTTLKELISIAAGLKIHLILVTVSTEFKEFGFSDSLKKCFTFIVLGRKGKSVGYDNLFSAIAGKSPLISNPTIKKRLLDELNTLIDRASYLGDPPIALFNLGTPSLYLLTPKKDLPRIEVSKNTQIQPKAPSSLNQRVTYPNDDLPQETKIEAFLPLSRAVFLGKRLGVSDTELIEEVLGFKGKYYLKGKLILQLLLKIAQDDLGK